MLVLLSGIVSSIYTFFYLFSYNFGYLLQIRLRSVTFSFIYYSYMKHGERQIGHTGFTDSAFTKHSLQNEWPQFIVEGL